MTVRYTFSQLSTRLRGSDSTTATRRQPEPVKSTIRRRRTGVPFGVEEVLPGVQQQGRSPFHTAGNYRELPFAFAALASFSLSRM
jgi:hypothetical protein